MSMAKNKRSNWAGTAFMVEALVLLAVDPRDADAVAFHPLDHVRIALQAIHHPALEVALVLLEVPGALLRVRVFAVYANRHVR